MTPGGAPKKTCDPSRLPTQSNQGSRVLSPKEKNSEQAKFPLPTNIIGAPIDSAGYRIPSPPSATLLTPLVSPASQRQYRPPPSKQGDCKPGVSTKSTRLPAPVANFTLVAYHITTPNRAPTAVPMAPGRVFVPLPSTYHQVNVCEGESLKPLPSAFQQARGALYLQKLRPKLAPLPGRPQLRAKLIIPPGSQCRPKPPHLGMESPLRYCFWGGEAVSRRKVIRVDGKVVDPYLGPQGRPSGWKDAKDIPLGPLMHMHRKCLRDIGYSLWWPYLRAWQHGR